MGLRHRLVQDAGLQACLLATGRDALVPIDPRAAERQSPLGFRPEYWALLLMAARGKRSPEAKIGPPPPHNWTGSLGSTAQQGCTDEQRRIWYLPPPPANSPRTTESEGTVNTSTRHTIPSMPVPVQTLSSSFVRGRSEKKTVVWRGPQLHSAGGRFFQ